MSLMCQKDSYLREFRSAIISCNKSTLQINGKCMNGYDVVLQDTILFPEGGGQPYDTGFLGPYPVLNVRRDKDKAVVFVGEDRVNDKQVNGVKEDGVNNGEIEESNPAIQDPNSLPPELQIGCTPLQTVDWSRRFDHMQHHSGQHLITAIADQHFNMPTTSWNLGPEVCNIELDAPSITQDQISELETLVNEKIRMNLSVKMSYRDKNDLNDIRLRQDVDTIDSKMIRTDNIDSNMIRIIEIDGLDRNACCGTHVACLGHLQMVKLLGVQKGKKGKCLLEFVVGNRVVERFNRMLARERQLASAFKCSPEEFVAIVDKLQKQLKRIQKNYTTGMRDLAKYEAEKYIRMSNRPKLYAVHRKECSFDFITTFFNSIANEALNDCIIMVSITDDCNQPNSPGQVVVAGDKELLEQCANVAQQFNIKGSISQGRFRGRIPDVSKLKQFETCVKKELNLN